MPVITDATVVNQPYSTEGNGGRKLVRLDNGWLVCVLKSGGYVHLYCSQDNETTWELTRTMDYSKINDVALASKNNTVFIVVGCNDALVRHHYYDYDLGDGDSMLKPEYIEGINQSALSSVSLTINEEGTDLHAEWSSKNSTYPNSFNIRYSKGVINTDGSVTWGAVEQVTKENINNQSFDTIDPSIVMNKDGRPIILASMRYKVVCWYLNGATWSTTSVYNSGGTTHRQLCPSAISVPSEFNGLPNGLTLVAWHGRDAEHMSTDYIRFSKSSDNGASWSPMQKLVEGSNASLTANEPGHLYIEYERGGNTYFIKSTDNGDNWSVEQLKGVGVNPSTMFDDNFDIDFTAPLSIRQTPTEVLFSGAWTETHIYPIPMSLGIKDKPNNLLTYAITTDDVLSPITEKLNGAVINIHESPLSGEEFTVDLTKERWDEVAYGNFSDSEGGVNTLTIEIGNNKWLYTFDKRLADDDDLLTAVKALQDTDTVFLPAVKQMFTETIESKGGTVPDDPLWTDIDEAIARIPEGKKWASGVTTAKGNVVTVDLLTFKPSYISVSLDDGLEFYNGGMIYDASKSLNRYSRIVGGSVSSRALSGSEFVDDTGFSFLGVGPAAGVYKWDAYR